MNSHAPLHVGAKMSPQTAILGNIIHLAGGVGNGWAADAAPAGGGGTWGQVRERPALLPPGSDLDTGGDHPGHVASKVSSAVVVDQNRLEVRVPAELLHGTNVAVG